MSQHTEVGDLSDRQIIGFNPVYATHQSPTSTSKPANSPVLWGACLAVALICLASAGGLLWNKAEKSESEVQAEVQQALIKQRGQAIECLNQMGSEPTAPRRK
jgi:hypothetical protein